jgi:hypothetical protein
MIPVIQPHGVVPKRQIRFIHLAASCLLAGLAAAAARANVTALPTSFTVAAGNTQTVTASGACANYQIMDIG